MELLVRHNHSLLQLLNMYRINTEGFILKCLEIRSISLFKNKGPVVLQQLAQVRQSNSSKVSSWSCCIFDRGALVVSFLVF